MKKLLLILPLLALAACATGDFTKDCQNASTALTNANLANIVAQGYLRSHPNDEVAKSAAEAAALAVEVATAAQASACAAPALGI